jgi:trans-aconitate 2-methyltransferase
MKWDPSTYLTFGDQRTRPAADLLARIPADAPRRVADLGCGPGNSTALLARRWPQARIDGIDSSPAMLEQAESSGVAARWIAADIARWAPQAPYDVIFSNAAYQWLGRHESLLPRLVAHTAKGGVFAFQIPGNFASPSHALMRKVAEDGPWADRLRGVRDVSVLTPTRYYDILAPCVRTLDIWETTYLQVLSGEEPVFAWVRATGLRPFEQALDGAEREAFLGAYRRALRAAYPRRKDGTTLFAFRRLFVVAVR